MEEKLGFFRKMGIAISKPSEYSKLANEKCGKTVSTFFIISIIRSLVIMGILLSIIYSVLLPKTQEFINGLPAFEISKEGFEMNKAYAYDADSVFFIIDPTTYNIEQLKMKYETEYDFSKQYFVISNQEIELKDNEKTEMFLISELDIQPINNATLEEFYQSVKDITPYFMIGVAIVVLLWVFVTTLLAALIYSLIGALAACIVKADASFGQLFNISMYAMVLGIILSLLGLQFAIPLFGLARIIITIVYVVLGVKSLKKKEPKEAEIKE